LAARQTFELISLAPGKAGGLRASAQQAGERVRATSHAVVDRGYNEFEAHEIRP